MAPNPLTRYKSLFGICVISIFLFLPLSVIAKGPLKTIKLATYIEPPFSNYTNGTYSGAYIEIIQRLTKEMNINIQFVLCPAARCLQLLMNGDVDMMMGVRKTDQRKEYLHFLEPPIKIQEQPLRFYVRAESSVKIDHYDDLKKFGIGVLRGASYFDQFDEDKKLFKVPVTNHKQLVDMLLNERIDTFLEREESIKSIVDQQVYRHKIRLTKYAYNKSVASYIAISKKSKFMKDTMLFSKQLTSLKLTGDVQKIMATYKIN